MMMMSLGAKEDEKAKERNEPNKGGPECNGKAGSRLNSQRGERDFAR